MHDHIRYILLIYKSKILVKKTHSLNETVWFNRDLNRGSQPDITTAWTWAENKNGPGVMKTNGNWVNYLNNIT